MFGATSLCDGHRGKAYNSGYLSDAGCHKVWKRLMQVDTIRLWLTNGERISDKMSDFPTDVTLGHSIETRFVVTYQKCRTKIVD